MKITDSCSPTGDQVIVVRNKSVTVKINKTHDDLFIIISNLSDQLLQERHWTGVKEDGLLSRLCVHHDTKVKTVFLTLISMHKAHIVNHHFGRSNMKYWCGLMFMILNRNHFTATFCNILHKKFHIFRHPNNQWISIVGIHIWISCVLMLIFLIISFD